MVLRAGLFALLAFITASVKAQKDTVFAKEWTVIDSLILKQDLTKTALTKLDELSAKAKQRRLPAQAVKALIYRYTLQDRITTDDQAQQINSLLSEIRKTTDPAQKAVQYSLLASQYANYFDIHRWQLMQRRTANGSVDRNDIGTWSAWDFDTAIINNYRRSLKDKKILQQISVAAYDAVIIKGNMRNTRPTLFDLLAHAALDRFMQPDIFNVRSVATFTINDPRAMLAVDDFLAAKFPVKDSTDRSWQSLEIFRELLSFHRNDADKNALVDADLKRLQWVHDQGNFPGKDSIYKETLQRVADQFPKTEASVGAWLQMANLEIQKARNYNALNDTTNRYRYNAAEKIIQKALQQSWATEQKMQLENILAEIGTPVLSTEMETINLPGKPILATIAYRNVDTLYGRIYRIPPAGTPDAITGLEEPNWQILKNKPLVRSLIQPLPVTADHQLHHTDFKLDNLAPGSYMLVISTNPDFPDSSKYSGATSMQKFQVSRVSYIKNGSDFFVLDRETGQPISGIKVAILQNRYNRQQGKSILDTLSFKTTDKNGFFRSSAKREAVRFIFFAPNDTLHMGYDEYSFEPGAEEDPGADYETKNSRIFFFTDRSIYRPGQTAYFKGIAVTKDRNTQQSRIIAKNQTDWIYLRDVNGKTIDSIKVTINDYGSFAGSFRLPASGLTGVFSIYTKKYNQSQTWVSVEEYKRPLFNVSFDKPKGSYRLNDSILVTGIAKAYSGNAVSNAKVVYNITRRTQFVMPYYKRIGPPSMPEREIAHGEITTDKNGRFSIRFKALSDDIIDSTDGVLYNFAVSANATDINGETRTASTTIKTGFHSLILTMNAPSITEKDSLRNIGIETTNLSGEKQNAKVHVRVVSLLAPDRPIRARLISRVDQHTMSEAEFLRFFPNDEYDREADPAYWPSNRIVLEEDINTGETSQLTIVPGSLPAGHYKIEATATDNYGKRVITTSILQLVDRKQLSALTYNFTYPVNTTVEPGEEAVFLNGTSAGKIFVITTTARLKDKKTYETAYRNNGVSTLRYSARESDRGGVIIAEAFVYNNRFYTNQYRVNVPWTNKMLKVNLASYRNKTEPGTRETWTITIEGNKADSTASELLTSMYDASLDQFRPHNWSVPAVWNTLQQYHPFESTYNFIITQSYPVNIGLKQFTQPFFPIYDRLVVNAEEFWSERLSNPEWRMPMKPGVVGSLKNRAGINQELASDAKFTYTTSAKESTSGAVMIRGSASAASNAVFIVDGKLVANTDDIDPNSIVSTDVLQESEVWDKFRIKVSGSAIVITTRQAGTNAVQVRKDLNETAFFFPQLHADSSGKYSFSFTMPESLTQWKWMALAHTRDLSFGYDMSANIITQKKLMVQPNAPRFLREGDRVELSAKIANMSDREITGQATLELFDATNNTAVDGWFNNVLPAQYFTAEAGQSVAVNFPLQIPFSFNRPLTWRIVAKTGELSDGEENTLPVLTNRMLVTETLPLYLSKDTTQTFLFEKLLNNKSETLSHESLTVEYTSNPVWSAVQALPYLIDYPYECSEQTFNRLYANTLASYIVHKSPRLQQVFEQWKKDSTALLSNLQKNQELKQLLLQETPWVLQAETEEQQKKNIALLFDLSRLSSQTELFIQKLEQLQLADGGFAWFKGGNSDRYITNYILTGIGKLKRLGAMTPDIALRLRNIILQAIRYSDKLITEDYRQLIKSNANLRKQQVSGRQVDYLYMRSFFADIAPLSAKEAAYYYDQAKLYWTSLNAYYKAQLGLIAYRKKDEKFVTGNILPAILENASSDTKLGMYWKTTYTCFWYQSPIEHQSMMIAFIAEAGNGNYNKQLDDMKTWLLLNKQTNNWRTTIATADACYALLLNGSNWMDNEKQVVIRLGNYTAASNLQKTEAGTGYFKKRIDGKIVNGQMGEINVSVRSNNPKSSSPSWGSVYWQYFEDMDKISTAGSPLSLSKQLFIEKSTDKGKVLEPVKDGEELKVGDRIISRIILRSDRDMDYLHLKDMRAAAMEPVNVLSGYKWQDRLGYYESTKDVATDFFIDHLNKGTYVFEYSLFVTHTGVFSVGIATIQNMYAPEFSSHSEGIKIRVSK